jgi:uncharacterized protein YbaR (Trm112 family)
MPRRVVILPTGLIMTLGCHPAPWTAAAPRCFSPDMENDDATAAVPVDPRLLEILVCPVTKAPLTYDRARNELVSQAAGLAYPIRDGIPIMLPDEARTLD